MRQAYRASWRCCALQTHPTQKQFVLDQESVTSQVLSSEHIHQHWHLMGLEIQFQKSILSVSTITLKNLFPFKSNDIPNKVKVTGTNKIERQRCNVLCIYTATQNFTLIFLRNIKIMS